ncbi:MAG: hypothetical protein AAGG48_09390 [Planctomycetota bacterium]
MVEDVSLYRNAEFAIKIVQECPDAYRGYANDAFGRIALGASQREDAKGAWRAIGAIDGADGLYPYELVVAATLDDKTRGKKILLEKHNALITSIAGRKLMAREEWARILWILSFYRWCELNDEFHQLLDLACKTTKDPDKTRDDVMARLGDESPVEAKASDKQTKTTKVSPREIRLMLQSVGNIESPRRKAETLIAVAMKLTELDRDGPVGNGE